jgi:hypothetical protein
VEEWISRPNPHRHPPKPRYKLSKTGRCGQQHRGHPVHNPTLRSQSSNIHTDSPSPFRENACQCVCEAPKTGFRQSFQSERKSWDECLTLTLSDCAYQSRHQRPRRIQILRYIESRRIQILAPFRAGGPASSPKKLLVDGNPIFRQQLPKLILEALLAMVLLLAIDIRDQRLQIRRSNRKRAISWLPRKK